MQKERGKSAFLNSIAHVIYRFATLKISVYQAMVSSLICTSLSRAGLLGPILSLVKYLFRESVQFRIRSQKLTLLDYTC